MGPRRTLKRVEITSRDGSHALLRRLVGKRSERSTFSKLIIIFPSKAYSVQASLLPQILLC